MLTNLPRISSVGQSPAPQGISVVPKIKPKMKPNKHDRNMPTANEINPTRCKKSQINTEKINIKRIEKLETYIHKFLVK